MEITIPTRLLCLFFSLLSLSCLGQAFTFQDTAFLGQVAGSGAPAANSLNTGLISYWKLDEASGTRVDVGGAAQDLTDNNTVTQTTGKIVNAPQFTTANSEYLSHADSASLSIGADTSAAWSMWVYIDSVIQTQGLLSKWGNAGQSEYIIFWRATSTEFRFQISYDGTATTNVNSTAASSATWYHIYCQYDHTTKKIGISVNNATMVENGPTPTASIFDGNNTFKLGSSDGGVVYLGGRIDELGFWKRILTPTERTALYNSGAGKTCCPFL